MGSGHPRTLRAASQEAWPGKAQTLGNVKAGSVRSEQYGAIFAKFRGKMAHIWQGFRSGLRSGEWLTGSRMHAYCLILLGLSVLVSAGWIVASDGLISRGDGQPIGTDFSNVYAAGTLTWQGRSAEAYAPALSMRPRRRSSTAARCRSMAGTIRRSSLRLAVLVAAVPYVLGLTIWLVASFAGYLAAIRAILPRHETLLAAAAFPAVFVNIGHGQNGFPHSQRCLARAALARSPAMARGRADRPPGLHGIGVLIPSCFWRAAVAHDGCGRRPPLRRWSLSALRCSAAASGMPSPTR